MKTLILILSFILPVDAAQISAQCKDIRIQHGRIWATVKGVSNGARNYPCYRIRARDGQKITLHLASPDTDVNFSLCEDYYDAGSTVESVRDWEGGVGNVDAYLIYVGNGKRGSPFAFEVTIR